MPPPHEHTHTAGVQGPCPYLLMREDQLLGATHGGPVQPSQARVGTARDSTELGGPQGITLHGKMGTFIAKLLLKVFLKKGYRKFSYQSLSLGTKYQSQDSSLFVFPCVVSDQQIKVNIVKLAKRAITSFSLLLTPLSIHPAGVQMASNLDPIRFYTWRNPTARQNGDPFLKIW